jgi:hypothetical protein
LNPGDVRLNLPLPTAPAQPAGTLWAVNPSTLLVLGPYISLVGAQTTAIANVDAKTQVLLAEGFPYIPIGTDTVFYFALDLQGQMIWSQMALLANSFTYPYIVSTVDGTSTTLSNAEDVQSLYEAGVERITQVLQEGIAIKGRILSAGTVEAVEQIPPLA